MYRAARRENDVLDSGFVHGHIETYSSTYIVFVVGEGVFTTFAYGFESGKMDHTINLILLKDLFDFFGVFDVDLVEFGLFSHKGRELF